MTYAIGRAIDEIERHSKREGILEVANKMLTLGRSVEEIIEYTGLTYAKVEALRTKEPLN
ncbi:MAG: hypothetical protein LBL49_04500 [Clostridiales Family XIII bacterium]|jgi:predicted transposase YdaD|nr:hypothetical protein [Clostridiales Family XIII bacterium]